MYLYVRNPERNLAGYQIISPDDTAVRLQVKPAGTVVGNVYDNDRMPIANVQIMLVAGIDIEGAGSLSLAAKTDEQGKYTINALPVGSHGQVSLRQNQLWQNGPGFSIENPDTLKLDETVIRPAPEDGEDR